jgi:hypothetical protein
MRVTQTKLLAGAPMICRSLMVGSSCNGDGD